MRYLNYIFLFIFLFFFSLCSGAIQHNHKTVKIFNSNLGLPSNHIYCTLPAKNGFLWIGSQGGLTRYDGKFFKTFNIKNTPEITVNDVIQLFEDSKGKLWIFTNNEILTYEKKTFTKILSLKSFRYAPSFIQEHKNDTILLGFFSKLLIYKNNHLTDYSSVLDNNKKLYGCFTSETMNDIFLCTNKGLIVLDEKFKIKQKISDNIYFYAIKHWNDIYISCTNDGFYQILKYNKKWTIKKIEKLPNINIYNLAVDSKNNLFGVSKKLILQISKSYLTELNIEKLKLPNTISKEILDIKIDKENNIWIADKNGLILLRETTFSNDPLFSNKIINSIFVDQSGKILVGTFEYGAYIEKNNKIIKHFFKNKKVTVFFADSKNNYWISTKKHLYKISNNKINEIYGKNHKALKFIMAIYESHDGKIWFQYNKSIAYYQNDKTTVISNQSFLKTKNVRSFLESKNNEILIGTGIGLFSLKGTKISEIIDKNIFNKPFIFTLYQDADNVLWIGTDEGLYRYKNLKFDKITFKDGLTDNWVSSIFEDKEGNLWIGSDGIQKIKKSQLKQYWEKSIEKLDFKNFNKEDGLPTMKLNGGSQYCAYKDNKGNFWYATLKGLAKVNPLNIIKHTETPAPIIDAVFVENTKKNLNKPISLTDKEKRIVFEYTAPSFVKNNSIKFKIRLKGFNKLWKITSDRKVSYTNLSPGNYTFELKVQNSDGLWSEKIASQKFTVIRPFYMTWWFYSLCTLVAFILLTIFVKLIKYIVQSAIFMQKSKFVGPYKIIETIGIGGMGTVYKALSIENKQIVALKVLHETITEEDMKKRFIQEGIICEKISHPNIVKIYNKGEDRGRLYYAMEYCSGNTLRTVLNKEKLPLLKSLWVTSVVIDVVHDIHNKGIIHRDIKPENIMLTGKLDLNKSRVDNKLLPNLKNSLKLLDFGLAKTIGNTALTKTGLLAGTVYYLPPESIHTNLEWYPEADYYSAGILLYEMLTGLRPFEGEDLMKVMYQILEVTPPAPIQVNPMITEEISSFTMDLINKNIEQRLTKYNEIKIQLNQLIKNHITNL